MGSLMDFMGKYSAQVIAVCALFLTTYQAAMTRRHNRLTVKPHLTTVMHRHIPPESPSMITVTATLANRGLGPAIIREYEVLIDGKPEKADQHWALFKPMQRVFNGKLVERGTRIGWIRKGAVLGKDDKFECATLFLDMSDPADLAILEQNINRLQLRIQYESAYGEKFEYDSRKHFED